MFEDIALDIGYDGLIARVRTDDAFVKAYRLVLADAVVSPRDIAAVQSFVDGIGG